MKITVKKCNEIILKEEDVVIVIDKGGAYEAICADGTERLIFKDKNITAQLEQTMRKSEMREIAKDKLMEAIAVAYYKLEVENFSEEEKDQICEYINQYGEAMAKAINKKYYTM